MVLIEPLMLKYLISAKIRFYFKPVLWAEWRWKPLIFWFDFNSSQSGVERLSSAAQAARAAWHCSLISSEQHLPCWVILSSQEVRPDLGRAVNGTRLKSAQVVGTAQFFIWINLSEALKYHFKVPATEDFGLWDQAAISGNPCLEGWEQPQALGSSCGSISGFGVRTFPASSLLDMLSVNALGMGGQSHTGTFWYSMDSVRKSWEIL